MRNILFFLSLFIFFSVATLYGNGEITEISLEKGACYGKCPVYKVIFKSDGAASYFGEKNVERIGEFKGSIDKFYFYKLSQLIQYENFFDLEDNYESGMTDLPSAYVSVVKNGVRKSVRDYGSEGPIKLWTIETVIDALAEKINWLKE